MAYVGTLSVFEDSGSAGPVFNFINAILPGGWPSDTVQRVGEPITATGVDCTRARVTRNEFPVFEMDTISEAQVFNDAVIAVGKMRESKIKVASLSLVIAGTTYTFTNKAYIWNVEARPIRADVITTNGVLTNPLAMVSARWTLQFVTGV